MNQSILCNDDFTWHPEAQQVSFTAQAAGARITCLLSLTYLRKLGLADDLPEAIIKHCELMQFDIEEDAQQAIEEERLDETNKILLT